MQINFNAQTLSFYSILLKVYEMLLEMQTCQEGRENNSNFSQMIKPRYFETSGKYFTTNHS
jgi:hypothetical protein